MHIWFDRLRATLLTWVVATAMIVAAIPHEARSEANIEMLKRALKFQAHRLKALSSKQPAGLVPLVHNGGTENDAIKYYDRIAPLIGFPKLRESDLKTFLAYLGFEGLGPDDLELLDSALLMPATQDAFNLLGDSVADPVTFKAKRSLVDFAADRFLVSRFFAPKIVNFNDPPNQNAAQNPYKAGWRKLVRVEPLAGSAADQGNIREAYILMNYFQGDVAKNPFPQKPITPATESVNNQIILVPKTFEAQKADAAYWLVYQPNSVGYKLGFLLNAAFDDPKQGQPSIRPYYVPTACAQCHGHDDISEADPPSLGPFPYAKVNYLDTDQWYDMLIDFPGTKNGSFDVVFDGGRDQTTKQYSDAVGVLIRLNKKIKTQNEGSLRPDKRDQFKVDAADKWIKLHEADPKPAGPFQRAIGADPKWDVTKQLDADLLPMLTRYCFRCHSSIRFDVFDRQSTKGNAFMAGLYVSSDTMPEGRTLESSERAKLQDFLDKLCNEEPACF